MKKVNTVVERTYKDRIFRLIFKEKKELLSLYNAIGGTAYENPEELEINTLENAIYMSMKNDISFVIDSRMSLYEHQSTCNPNMPLRNLLYVASLLSKLTRDKNLYGTSLIRIPTPRFVVFYNGTTKQPEREEFRLSDSYEIQSEEIGLELKVLMLNINPGYNGELLKNCKTLRDYVIYVDKVRTYAKEMNLDEAVDRAITECIAENILAEFLTSNKAEAKSMSIFEYDEEKHMQQVLAEGIEQGIEQGESSFALLTEMLLKDSRIEDLSKAAKDKRFRKGLYEEYGIKI